MAVEKDKKRIDQIKKLKQFLPDKTQEKLDEILAYGEMIKADGERKKKEFWREHVQLKGDFSNMLRYLSKHQKEIESEYEYLDKMNDIERKKFIEEYLYDDILYHGNFNREEFVGANRISYRTWKIGKQMLGYGTVLDASHIGLEGVKDIAKNLELKERVWLVLQSNQMGNEGAEVLSHMKLKDGVVLNLVGNEIGDEGAKAIAENMELREGVDLDLHENEIGDAGAEAIMKNMKLKDGVNLDLKSNKFSKEMIERLKNWVQYYEDAGIKCSVLV